MVTNKPLLPVPGSTRREPGPARARRTRTIPGRNGWSLALALCLAGLFSANLAMGGAVRGVVQDSLIGLFLSDARVTIEGKDDVSDVKREATSQTGGRFSFGSLAPGTYTVRASYIGYPDLRETVEIKEVSTEVELNLDFNQDDIVELETFTVEGSLVGRAKALNVERSADNYKNVISSDAIGQFVDRNAAEALQRLPGISVEDNQGEGRFVIIRGADPSLNNLTIDGVVAATPEEDGRSTALNIISIDQLESIEVLKTWLPDGSANFIGGSVDLITRSALDRGERFASVEGAYGQHKLSDENGYRFSATYGDVLLKKKNLGIQFSINLSEDNRASDTVKAPLYEADTESRPRNSEDPSDLSALAPNGFQLDGLTLEDFVIKRQRTGFSGKIEYALNDNNSFYFSFSKNKFDDDETLQTTVTGISLSNNDYAGSTVFTRDIAIAAGLDPDSPEVLARLAKPPQRRDVRFPEAVALGDLLFDEDLLTYRAQKYRANTTKRWRGRLITDNILTMQAGGRDRLFDRFDLDYKIYKSDADKDWTEQQIDLDSSTFTSVSGIDANNLPFMFPLVEGFLDNEATYRFNDEPNIGLIRDNLYTSTDERSGLEANLETGFQLFDLDWKLKLGGGKDFREKNFDRDFNRWSRLNISDASNLITLENGGFSAGIMEGFMKDACCFDFSDPVYDAFISGLGEDFSIGGYDFGPHFDTPSARSFIDSANRARSSGFDRTTPGITFLEIADDVTSNTSEAVIQNYGATEDITSVFFMATADWQKFRFIAGMRYEKTENTFTNNVVDTRPEELQGTFIKFASPGLWDTIINNENFGTDVLLDRVTSERSYDHLLPAFHVIYRHSENLMMRAAYTQTIARPTFTDLIPREFIGISGADFSNSVQLANFELRPEESENFDLSLDYFLGKVGKVGVAFFYKNLDGPVYTETRTIEAGDPEALRLSELYVSSGLSTGNWASSRRANAGNGSLAGVEISFDRKLDFLPGFWNGFGFNFNTSFISSEVELPLEERLGEKVPRFKQSDRLTNLSAYFEKYGFLARASFLWRGGYLDSVQAGTELINTNIETRIGTEANSLDLYQDDFFRLDLRVEYRHQKWGTVFFEGTNLTNEPSRQYYGIPARVAFIRYTGPIYYVGYKWNL